MFEYSAHKEVGFGHVGSTHLNSTVPPTVNLPLHPLSGWPVVGSTLGFGPYVLTLH